jgi:ubiquinone biosynthesis protein
MERNIRKSIRNLKRYQEILRVFVKFGFNDIVNKISIAFRLRIDKNLLMTQHKDNHYALSSSVRLRRAFEELGATFIKLGQMLSLRSDIIPAEFAVEFSKLQDSVQKDEFDNIKSVLIKEFGKPSDEIFLEFDETPIAAGSVAQVHKARLKSGEAVAVKILHSGIAKKIESDLEILKDLARLIEIYIPESKHFEPHEIIKEFSKTIKKELNLVLEGHNIDTFRNYLQDDPIIKIPVVYWEYTTESILTIDFIKGIKISDLQNNEVIDVDKKQVTMNAANSLMKQIFEVGIYHADPHPGNIFVLPGNIIAPIDFGIVGRIDDEMRNTLVEIVMGIVGRDPHRIARILINVGLVDDHTNLRELKLDLMEFLDYYYSIPLNRIILSKLINEFVELTRTHQIKLPTDFIILAKTLAISETVARELNPQFSLTQVLIPFAKKAYLKKMNPFTRYRSLIRTLEESFDLLKKLPGDLQSILYKFRNDKFIITFKHEGLEEFSRTIDCSSNRLSFAIIIAALIISTSIFMNVGKENLLLNYPLIGICGFLVASILGIWLLIGIIRSGKL